MQPPWLSGLPRRLMCEGSRVRFPEPPTLFTERIRILCRAYDEVACMAVNQATLSFRMYATHGYRCVLFLLTSHKILSIFNLLFFHDIDS